MAEPRIAEGPVPPAADAVGAATLERLQSARKLNRWMYDRIAPWIGDRVLEIGSGIGNLSQFLVGRERVVLTDTEPAYRAYLQERFGETPGVEIHDLTLPARAAEVASLGAFRSVVCLNVLEHIEDDAGALASMRDLVAPSGRVVLLVPALRWLYGELDRSLGHYRRYTRRSLRELYARVGLRLRHLEYFNTAGMPGWWFVGRVLRRRRLPTASLSLYDALVPLFRLERLVPFRIGQSLIAVGERT